MNKFIAEESVKASLGFPFLCWICGHRHHPDKNAWKRCYYQAFDILSRVARLTKEAHDYLQKIHKKVHRDYYGVIDYVLVPDINVLTNFYTIMSEIIKINVEVKKNGRRAKNKKG